MATPPPRLVCVNNHNTIITIINIYISKQCTLEGYNIVITSNKPFDRMAHLASNRISVGKSKVNARGVTIELNARKSNKQGQGDYEWEPECKSADQRCSRRRVW